MNLPLSRRGVLRRSGCSFVVASLSHRKARAPQFTTQTGSERTILSVSSLNNHWPKAHLCAQANPRPQPLPALVTNLTHLRHDRIITVVDFN
jgi:hypothetical protein